MHLFQCNFFFKIMLEIQTILQKNLQSAYMVSDYW